MKKHSIGSRLLSLLLALAMILPMIPMLRSEVSAATGDVTKFLTAAQDGITMLNNGNHITLPIKVNNFVLDGMLFDYLSSTRSANNADSYYWEYSKDNGRAYIQLYPYYLSDKSIGDSSLNIVSTTGLSGPVAINGTLDANTSTTLDTYGNRSDGAPQAWRPLTPTKVTDGGGTAFLRLTPDGQRDNTNGNNPNGTGKHRAWTKLTTFETTHTPVVDDIRYAVLIYRLPNGTSVNDYDTGAKYPNMGLTINYFDEAAGSCSRYVTVNTAANSNWQYAIIDLMGLGTSDNRRILSGTKVNSVYLQTPLSYQDATNYMDVAGVAYFPYYGDAEQFAYFGVTMGCQQKYFNANNAGFSLRNHTNTHYAFTGSTRTKVLVKSLPTFWTDNEYLGSRTFNVDTYGNHKLNNTTLQNLQTLTDLFNPMSDGSTKTILDTTGTNLFGTIQGQATLGLVEAELGEDGRPVYKKSVVHYLAAYLRHQLLTLPEYPSDNYGWRNYSFITGVSTSGGTNEALFGTNSQGQSIDLATALCQQIGVKKGGAVKSGTSGSFGYASHYDYELAGPDDGYYGNYADTIAHKDDLIGTWSECKGNIHTWFDAAYYLLHNLYVTDTDVADVKVDGYGEYEDDYQALIVPQVQFTSGGKTSTPYFFDSGYSYYTNIDDNSTYTSALVFDKTQHTITLSGDAQGAAQFNITDGQLATSWFPFLLTSGNGTGQGETNSPYYLHDGVISRETQGTTYRSRDFHYSLTGSGYFAYEPGLYFNFRGDDDVFVFINGQLVVDLGGTHGAAAYNMSLDDYVTWANNVKSGKEQYKGSNYAGLSAADKARVDALCLVTGGVYSFDFFYMERHGVGSNLRIMTNMQIVESNLKVDKFAYQNGVEVTDNGIGDMDAVLEYGFSITNNSDGKLYDLSFTDTTIGVSINCDRGLEVTGNVTNAYGSKLTPSGLVITVDGYNQSGDKLDTIYVTCPDNESLKAFLKTLSSSGTEGGNVEQDYDKPYSGSGLWKNATVTIRGIYYQLTETQKKVSSFTNSVVGTGFAKVAGENGLLENYVLRGIDKHTFYQPGKPVYYQWVNHPIVIESERLYSDLLAGNIVESANDLPSPENMILIPSNSGGTEIAMDGLSNVPGGDVYLKINYTTPGSYMAYVTVRDAADDTFSMTVPITIYAVGGHDSVIVLDYGLDTYLTENDAILKDELDAATGNVTGSILGIAKDTITPTYQKYDEQSVIEAPGQLANNLSILTGTYDSATGDHDGVVYELDKPVYLDHNKPWVIEWKALHEGVGTLLFSEMSSSTYGNYYIFLSPGAGRVLIGHHDSEHIDIGTPDELKYNNYGVEHSAIKSAVGKMTEFKLINVPDGKGGNDIHCFVGGTNAGILNDYYQGGESTNYKDQTWVSGKDFTFNFVGTTGHDLNDKYEYIRVYEDGYQLTHSKWERTGTTLSPVNTGESGYHAITTTYHTYNYTNPNTETVTPKRYWAMSEGVTLAHDDNWKISYKLSGINHELGVIVLGAYNANVVGSTHLYMVANTNGEQMVFLGVKNPASIGSHYNYGVNVKEVIPDFSLQDEHTYVLENKVLPTGGNMVYLTVDGTYIGPMDAKYLGSHNKKAESTNELSGMDFTFHYIGDRSAYGFYASTDIDDLEIRTKTTLNNSYEWIPGGSGLTSTVATDNKGNQIVFEKEADGIVEAEDGNFRLDSKGLKFELDDIMDDRYSIYVALAIHDKGFSPTAIDVDGIDIGHEAQLFKKVTVLPANVVYYEDDFPAIHYMGTQKNTFTELKNQVSGYDDYSDTYYMQTGSSEGLTQSPDQNTPFGSDSTYSDISANVSGGTVHTIAINNDGPLAWFNFTGRGFEIDARTNATDSGMIMVDVYLKSDVTINGSNLTINGSPVKTIPVITKFDNGNMVNGSFQSNNGGSEAIYQVPIIQYNHSQVADMVVVISGVENVDYYNGETHIDSYLYLDGIRIFRPLGNDVSEKDPNGNIISNDYGDQNNAIFNELRDYIVNGDALALNFDGTLDAGTGTLMLTEKYNNKDTSGADYIGSVVTDVNDYFMEGPNNEVYLEGTFSTGAIAFYVRESTDTNVGANKLLHLGARAIDMGLYHGAGSTGMKANLMLGVQGADGIGWTYIGSVTSGTEQYYNVNYKLCPVVTIGGLSYYQVVIKVASCSDEIPAMVSFTNLKRTSGLLVCEEQFKAADLTLNDFEESVVNTNTTSYALLRKLTMQMASNRYIDLDEVESGASFDSNEGSSTEAPVVVPKYPTLALEGEVLYNIYFDVENMTNVSTDDMGLLLFDSKDAAGTIDTAASVIPGAVYAESTGYYRVSTDGVPAKNLGDTIYFKVYAKQPDGSYVYSDVYGYNAIQYVNEIFAKSDNAQMKALCVAMLNYGAAAQQYFGYKTDSLMNAGLTAEQQALVQAYSADIVSDVSVDTAKVGNFAYTNSGFTTVRPAVSFDGAFAINYYVQPSGEVEGDMKFYYWTQEAYDNADELTAENASGIVTMTADGNSYSYSYTDIAAKEVNEAVYIAVEYTSDGTRHCTGVIAYSIGKYCDNVIGNAKSTAAAIELAKATALYGHYAEEYFA